MSSLWPPACFHSEITAVLRNFLKIHLLFDIMKQLLTQPTARLCNQSPTSALNSAYSSRNCENRLVQAGVAGDFGTKTSADSTHSVPFEVRGEFSAFPNAPS